jgi:hypothetical protein
VSHAIVHVSSDERRPPKGYVAGAYPFASPDPTSEEEQVTSRSPNDALTRRCRMPVARSLALASLLLAAAGSLSAQAPPAPPRYAPLAEYLMPRDAEIALAGTAAPPSLSGRATVKLLTPAGYTVARDGDNGFVRLVLRGWSAPTFTPAQFRALVYDATVRAPICYDAVAARTVLPYQELRARLAMGGAEPDRIAAGVQSAYATGALPRTEPVAFAGPFPLVSDDAGTPFAVTVTTVAHDLAERVR